MRLASLSAFLLFVALGACSADRTRSLDSELIVQEGVLNFGMAGVGGVRARTLRLTNSGRAPLVVRVDPGDGPFRVEDSQLRIEGGEEVELKVRFHPASVGARIGVL